jgi:hypothetical protein
LSRFSGRAFEPRIDEILMKGVLHSRNFSKVLEQNFEKSRRLIGWTVQAFRETQSSDPRDKLFRVLVISGL